VPQLVHAFVYKSDNQINLGHLAERNNKRLGKNEVEEREAKKPGLKKPKREKVWWRGEKVDKSLANLTPKQKRKYIETGKKD